MTIRGAAARAYVALAGLCVAAVDPFQVRRTRRRCWHHDQRTGQTWLVTRMIDLGFRKITWCTRCGETKIV